MEGATPTSWAELVAAVDAVNQNSIELGIVQARLAVAGSIAFDDPQFAGDGDDETMANVLAYIQTQTYIPAILFGNREYVFTADLGQLPDGTMFVGTGRGWLNSEKSIYHTRWKIDMAAGTPFIQVLTGSEGWNWFIGGIDMYSTNTVTQFAATAGTGVCWASTFHNLTAVGFDGVFGNSTTKFTSDLCTWNGLWEILTCYDTAVNIGGADNRGIFESGMNIGSGSTVGGEKFLMIFSSNSKANIGPIYLTADNGWRGMLFKGSSSSGYGQVLTGAVVEGRNPGDPCNGNLIRVEGGAITLRDINVNCGMFDPTATSTVNANATDDRGLIEVVGTDTQVCIDGLTVSHATGVDIDTPVVYAAGTVGDVMVTVRNVMRSVRSGGPAWVLDADGVTKIRPRISESTAGLIVEHDATAELV